MGQISKLLNLTNFVKLFKSIFIIFQIVGDHGPLQLHVPPLYKREWA